MELNREVPSVSAIAFVAGAPFLVAERAQEVGDHRRCGGGLAEIAALLDDEAIGFVPVDGGQGAGWVCEVSEARPAVP
jgi:hypothetical protein